MFKQIIAFAKDQEKRMKGGFRLILFFFALFWFSFHLFYWFSECHGVPERDAYKFFYPQLNYLVASSHIGNNFSLLAEKLSAPEYPHGYLFSAALFSAFGFQKLVLSFPPLLLLPLLVLISSLCFLPVLSPGRAFLLASLCYFHPLTQIALKGQSPHSWCTLLPLVGLFFLSVHRAWAYVLFGVLLFLGGIHKHLGVLYAVVLLFLFLVDGTVQSLAGDQRTKKVHLPALIISLVALVLIYPFYPQGGANTYASSVGTHFHGDLIPTNPVFYLGLITLVVGLILRIKKWSFLRFPRKRNEFVPWQIACFVFVLALQLLLPYSAMKLHSLDSAYFLMGILMMALALVQLIDQFPLETKLIFQGGILCLCAGILLFGSGMGGTVYVLHFGLLAPVFLLLVLGKKGPYILLMIFLVWVHFFPTSLWIQENYGREGYDLVSKMFEGPFNDFWSMNQNEIHFAQQKLREVMETIDLPIDKNMAVADVHVNLDLRTSLLYHRNLLIRAANLFPLDAMEPTTLDRWFQEYEKDQDAFFQSLHKKKEIRFFLVGMRQGAYPPDEGEFDGSRELFGLYLGRMYFAFLKNQGLIDKEYQKIRLGEPGLAVFYVDSDLRSKTKSQEVHPLLEEIISEAGI